VHQQSGSSLVWAPSSTWTTTINGLPPIQEQLPAGHETSWRSYLFNYVGKNGQLYDCPATERSRSIPKASRDRLPPAPQLVGLPLNGEIKLLSGIWRRGCGIGKRRRSAPAPRQAAVRAAFSGQRKCSCWADGPLADVRLEWANGPLVDLEIRFGPTTPGFNAARQGDKRRRAPRSSARIRAGRRQRGDAGRRPHPVQHR